MSRPFVRSWQSSKELDSKHDSKHDSKVISLGVFLNDSYPTKPKLSQIITAFTIILIRF